MRFWRRRAAVPALASTQDVAALQTALQDHPVKPDVLLAKIVAGHFEDGDVDGTTARFSVNGLDAAIECSVVDISAFGDYWTSAFYLSITGGGLGDRPLLASAGGYDASPELVVASGGCHWTCSFRDAMLAAQTGGPDAFETELAGRRFRVAIATWDRDMTVAPGEAHVNLSALPELTGWSVDTGAARMRLGDEDGWLTTRVLDSGTLPVLAAPTATLVSVFVAATPKRTVEVMVNGRQWLASTRVFDDCEPEPDDVLLMLRELAVLVPLEPFERFDAAALSRTLAGIGSGATQPREAAGWQGWQAHRGELGPVWDEDLADLPDDYCDFLTRVAGPGAGPGYGLLAPRVVDGVIPLAHAGCGVTWILRDGEVWVHGAGGAGTVAKVADSFTAWYAAWLDHAVRDAGPWLQRDHRGCAATGVLAELFEDVERRGELERADTASGFSLAGRVVRHGVVSNGLGDSYLEAGPVDPCHGCVAFAADLGLAPDVFAPGAYRK